jgi:D-aspartate ligase
VHCYSCTEFKKDPRDGIYKLMEVNGRHNLSSLLSVECGLNFPWIQYQHLMDGVVPSQKKYTTGVYWVDISRDIGYGVLNFRKQKYSLIPFLRPYFGRRVFAIFKITDLKPALLKNRELFERLLLATKKYFRTVFYKNAHGRSQEQC